MRAGVLSASNYFWLESLAEAPAGEAEPSHLPVCATLIAVEAARTGAGAGLQFTTMRCSTTAAWARRADSGDDAAAFDGLSTGTDVFAAAA